MQRHRQAPKGNELKVTRDLHKASGFHIRTLNDPLTNMEVSSLDLKDRRKKEEERYEQSMKLYTALSTQANSTRSTTDAIETMGKQIEDIKGIYQESAQETADIKEKLKQLEELKKIETNKLKISIKRFQQALAKQREKESLIKVSI
jgi:hypothetical protein